MKSFFFTFKILKMCLMQINCCCLQTLNVLNLIFDEKDIYKKKSKYNTLNIFALENVRNYSFIYFIRILFR